MIGINNAKINITGSILKKNITRAKIICKPFLFECILLLVFILMYNMLNENDIFLKKIGV